MRSSSDPPGQHVYIVSSRKHRLETALADSLEREGIRIWIDHAGQGDSWQAVVKSWMVQADLIIAVWTADALVCDKFQSEWEIAVGLEQRVLVVQVGNVELPHLPSQCALVRVESLSKSFSAIAAFMKARSIRQFFISYSRKDLAAAEEVLRLFARSDHRAWIDQSGIEIGEQFPERIFTEIDRADIFLLLWSANARHSRWVEREWNYAYRISKPMVPVLLDTTPLPMALEGTNGIPSLTHGSLFQLLGVPRPPSRT